MILTRMQTAGFQKTLQEFLAVNRRAMPWREAEADGSYDPYKILTSEIMLQQTQVLRVMPSNRNLKAHAAWFEAKPCACLPPSR